MAGSNQYSRGLKFFLASIVLLFFLAITVESRAVSFTAPLTPESSGKVTSDNKKLVGNAIVYVALKGRNAFSVTGLAAINQDPKTISRASIFETDTPKNVLVNLTYNKDTGFYQVNERISFAYGQMIHQHKTSVGFYLEDKKSETLAVAGVVANNRTTFISYLDADSETDSPSGVSSNDGFASLHAYANDDGTAYFLTATVNHDLDDKITGLHLHGPAPSGAANAIIISFDIGFTKAGRTFNTQINTTVFYWMQNSLTYLNIHTSKNLNGAIRGQVIPLTSPRSRIPEFPNGATRGFGDSTITFLPDGSTILGNVSDPLGAGGARPGNKTLGQFDERVAYFYPNNASTFANVFRFPLPVTLVNRYNTRGALVIITATAEVADNAKWTFNLYNTAEGSLTSPGFSVPGLGNRTYSTASADIGPDQFSDYLNPGGIFVQLTGKPTTANPLYVDRFYTVYFIASAYSNNVVRSIFISGSKALSS